MEARILQNGDVVVARKEHSGFGRVCGTGFFAVDLIFDDGGTADGVPEDEIEPIPLDDYALTALGFRPVTTLFGTRWIYGKAALNLTEKRRSGEFQTRVLGKKVIVKSLDQMQRLLRIAGNPGLANTIFAGDGY